MPPETKPPQQVKTAPTFAESLKKWIDETFFNKQKTLNNPLATFILSRFGLKNAQDVLSFLMSFGGKALKSEAEEKIIQKTEMQHELLIRLFELLFLSRLRILLLTLFLDRKSQASTQKQLELLIEQQNELLHRKGVKDVVVRVDFNFPNPQQYLDQTLAYYNKTMANLLEKSQQNEQERVELEELLQSLALESTEIINQFNNAQAAFHEMHTTLFGNDPERPAVVTPKILEQHIQANILKAQEQAAKLKAQLPNQVKAIQDVKNHLLGINLQIQMLNQILSVLKNESYYADAKGNTVDSYQDAVFILPKGPENKLQVIEYENKLYLLQPGQNWDSMGLDERHAAQNQYELQKPLLLSAHHAVQRNKEQAQAAVERRLNEVQPQLEQNKANKAQLDEQMAMLQAAKVSTQQLGNPELKLQPEPKPIPVNQLEPKPAPGKAGQATVLNPEPPLGAAPPAPEFAPRPGAPSPSPTWTMQWYKDQLELLHKNQTATLNDFYAMAMKAPHNFKETLTNFLNNIISLDKILANVKQNTPLKPQEKKSLLNSLEQFSSTTNFKAAINSFREQKEAYTAPRPNPFSTDPFKQ